MSEPNSLLENQKENIVVWLDFDAYAYTNFGIALALSKLGQFNFIGIVTTQQDISFFQNQKLIPFRKLIYYPECYNKKSSFNIENLKNFEKEFDLHLWLDVFAERSFYKYWTDFHKFSRDEIFSIIENSILFFNEILDNYKPKLVFMQQAGENISNLLFYKVAKNRGITTLMPNVLHLKNRILVSNNLENSEISDGFEQLISKFNSSETKYDEEYIQKLDHTESLKIKLSYHYEISSILKKLKYSIGRITHKPESIYKNIGKTRLKMLSYRITNYFEIRKRKQTLDELSIKSIEDKKFLYFPLASEPEAHILTNSSFFSNQVTLAENIAKAIPIDTVLYVKEHPVQKAKLWRPIEDYKRISSIPNVKLVHPTTNNQELISKSQAVMVISGSTGFEALFHKKPVILFSKDHYDKLSMVTRVRSFNDLKKDIDNALSDFKFNDVELSALMKVYDDLTLSVPYSSMLKDGNTLSAIQRYENDLSLTISEFTKFYESYRPYFELIAKDVYSKI